MIRVIMKFFRKFLKIDNNKIKVQLMAHKNIDIKETVEFWSKLTKIPTSQFIKTYCATNIQSQKQFPPRLHP